MKKIALIFSFLLGIIILILLGRYVGIQDMIIKLKSIHPLLFIPLIFFYSISWMFRAKRLQQIGRILQTPISSKHAFFIEILGNFANIIIPAKMGDAVKVFYFNHKYGLSYKRGIFISLIIRIMDVIAVVGLLLCSALFISREAVGSFFSYVLLSAAFIILSLILAAIFYYRPRIFLALLIGPLRRLRPTLQKIHALFRNNLLSTSNIIITSLLVWIFDTLVLYLILHSFQVQLDFSKAIFVLTISNLVKAFPITPEAIGVFEGVMVAVLSQFGVNSSTAFAIAIIDHGFKIVYTFAAGAYVLYCLRLSPQELWKKLEWKPD